MVSTRQHPAPFPAPELVPAQASPAKRGSKRSSPSASSKGWSHTPSAITLFWMALSLPLVIWDTGYVLLRPHSMPGGSLHWPLWVPYELYGTIDHIYGWPAYNAKNGFTAAQGTLNAVETLLYFVYLGLVYRYGAPTAADKGIAGRFGFAKEVSGKAGGLAVVTIFAASVATLSKTVLYWLNEAFSGFHCIGHNPPSDLLFLWIIPNGAWLVFPTYLIYVFGTEIIEGLDAASSSSSSSKKLQ